MKKINLIGASGSIGQQTIDVIRQHPEDFQLVAAGCGKDTVQMREIIKEFNPTLISVLEEADAKRLRGEFPATRVVSGIEGLTEVACYDAGNFLLNAVVGSIGLRPTLAAIAAGKDIGIANKETLVTAGHIVMDAVRKSGVKFLPVDSEHSAIFQCLQGEQEKNIERLVITASGGSFRNRSRDELADVTVEDALAHPNWSMGAKLTVDSATMMNKGLEVIEAHWLFDLSFDKIDVLLHNESIIHSMVEFCDSSVMAQLGSPDMRVPIQYVLSYPDRIPLERAKRLNLAEAATLHFKQMDFDRFPCLRYAYDAGKVGGTMPTVMNAANEVAVQLFLSKQIPFLEIEKIVETQMGQHVAIRNPAIDVIHSIDQEIRETVLRQYK